MEFFHGKFTIEKYGKFSINNFSKFTLYLIGEKENFTRMCIKIFHI